MKKTRKPGKKSLIYGFIWLTTYLGGLMIFKYAELSKTAGIITALVPALTFALFVYHFIRGIAAMDEVKKQIQFEAVVIGFSLSILLLMALALFGMAIKLNYAWWGYKNLVLYFIIFYYAGMIISARKYS